MQKRNAAKHTPVEAIFSWKLLFTQVIANNKRANAAEPAQTHQPMTVVNLRAALLRSTEMG